MRRPGTSRRSSADPERRAFHELVLPEAGQDYEALLHTGSRVRPRLFAADRPALVLDLSRLWAEAQT